MTQAGKYRMILIHYFQVVFINTRTVARENERKKNNTTGEAKEKKTKL